MDKKTKTGDKSNHPDGMLWAQGPKTEMPAIYSITRIISENDSVKSFFFANRKEFSFRPGQFIMLWLPGMDEKPFTISRIDDDEFSVTIEKKGEYTKKLFELSAGDKLGIRGPYGNGFDLEMARGKKVCVIGGGCGTAPVMPLIKELEKISEVMAIVGCQSKARLIFADEMKAKSYNICTDDGSIGFKGFVTQKFLEIVDSGQAFDYVYTCGPEPMMKAVLDICIEKDIGMQASLERFMICAIGICGQCMCDGIRICQDGPVIRKEKLALLDDFGKRAMIKTGKKVPLKEYYSYRTKY